MIKKELVENIYVEGYDQLNDIKTTLPFHNMIPVLFIGKTSEIPENVVNKYIDLRYEEGITAKDFIISSLIRSDKTVYEYCIIYVSE